MNTSSSSWLLLLLAICAASLPFLSERLFGIVTLKNNIAKPIWVRLLELITLYFVVGAVGFFLESHAGNRFEQNWEFFAITFCLFIVLGFPGFVFRYLRR